MEFRKITDKPVRAVIYTAFHVDHINGVKAFASTDDVEAGRVAIIAHETLLANVIRSTGTIGPILGMRTAYNFGATLDGADIAEINAIWRNWYLSAARGLEVIDPQVLRSGMARLARSFAPPDLIAALPVEPLLKDLRFGSRRRRRSTSS